MEGTESTLDPFITVVISSTLDCIHAEAKDPGAYRHDLLTPWRYRR
jgi:hypothetical protein